MKRGTVFSWNEETIFSHEERKKRALLCVCYLCTTTAVVLMSPQIICAVTTGSAVLARKTFQRENKIIPARIDIASYEVRTVWAANHPTKWSRQCFRAGGRESSWPSGLKAMAIQTWILIRMLRYDNSHRHQPWKTPSMMQRCNPNIQTFKTQTQATWNCVSWHLLRIEPQTQWMTNNWLNVSSPHTYM